MAHVRCAFVLFACLLGYCVLAAEAQNALEALEALFAGRATQLDQRDSKLIQFWTDAGRVEDDETSTRCSIDYIRQLQDKIEADMQATRLSDVIELYYYAELDLLSSCGDKVAGLAIELNPLLVDNENLELAVEGLNKWLHDAEDKKGSLPFVAEWMMWTVGANRCLNREEFICAWNRGPCSKVLDKLAEPRMEPLVNFVEMIDDTQINPMKLISNVPRSLVALAQCCRYFRSEDTLSDAWQALQHSDIYQAMYCDLTLALVSSDDDIGEADYEWDTDMEMDLDSP